MNFRPLALLVLIFFLSAVLAADSNSQLVTDANSSHPVALDTNSQHSADANSQGGSTTTGGNPNPPSNQSTVPSPDANFHSVAVPPVTTIVVSLGADGNSASFTLSCLDSSSLPCALTKYALDTNSQGGFSFGLFVVYSAPVGISGDGNWGVQYFSQDSNGNTEAAKTSYIIIRKKAFAAPDSSSAKTDTNSQADVNSLKIPGLNSVHDFNKTLDLNKSADLNGAIDLNKAVDLNRALDLNRPLGINSHVDLNSPDQNTGRDTNTTDLNKNVVAAAIIIPDFNFFRVTGLAGNLYLASFDLNFLWKVKGFVDSVFSSLQNHDRNSTSTVPSNALSGLFIVPDANYFSALDSNSQQALGFVAGIKSAIDSFLQNSVLPQKPKEKLREQDMIVNGKHAKCYGKCDSVPAVVH